MYSYNKVDDITLVSLTSNVGSVESLHKVLKNCSRNFTLNKLQSSKNKKVERDVVTVMLFRFTFSPIMKKVINEALFLMTIDISEQSK